MKAAQPQEKKRTPQQLWNDRNKDKRRASTAKQTEKRRQTMTHVKLQLKYVEDADLIEFLNQRAQKGIPKSATLMEGLRKFYKEQTAPKNENPIEA